MGGHKNMVIADSNDNINNEPSAVIIHLSVSHVRR